MPCGQVASPSHVPNPTLVPSSTGEIEPYFDGEAWSDMDPARYDEITAETFGLSRPEGFVWTCCDQGGEETGCRSSRHVSDPTRNRRFWGDDSSLSSCAEEPEAAGGAYNMGADVLEQSFIKSVDGDRLKETVDRGGLPRKVERPGPRLGDEVNAYIAAVKAWRRGATPQVASRAERAARRHMEHGPE